MDTDKIKKFVRHNKDGTETVRYGFTYRDRYGKKRTSKISKTRKAARDLRTDINYDVKRGVHTPRHGSITLDKAIDLWLASKELAGGKRSSLRSYRQSTAAHLRKSWIASIKLADLTEDDVKAFYEELVREHSITTAQKSLRWLKSVLIFAVEQKLLGRNVAAVVKYEKPQKRKMRAGRDFPLKEEVARLIDAVPSDPYQCWLRPFTAVGAFTGMRMSEIRALIWENVHFDRREIDVTQACNPDGPEIWPPKTEAAERTIPMAPELFDELWKKAYPEGGNVTALARTQPTGLVFRRGELRAKGGKGDPRARDADDPTNDLPMTAETVDDNFVALQRSIGMVAGAPEDEPGEVRVYSDRDKFMRQVMPIIEEIEASGIVSIREIARELERREVPTARGKGKCKWQHSTLQYMLRKRDQGTHRYHFHTLRHFAASVFISLGYDRKRVQELMGHEDAETTDNLYGHLFPPDRGDDQRRLGLFDDEMKEIRKKLAPKPAGNSAPVPIR